MVSVYHGCGRNTRYNILELLLQAVVEAQWEPHQDMEMEDMEEETLEVPELVLLHLILLDKAELKPLQEIHIMEVV